jgi:arsenate reductase-like glutaredoxin family protein
VDAKKNRIGVQEALALARSMSHVYATKGKSVVHLDMKKDAPTDEQLIALLIGPSGNLRAPAIRQGQSLLVGFDEEVYRTLLR